MKITIYTITDCAFSKQEKEYLSSHGLQFEEKNLETNREFLTEMLAVGSNFAGTPVTKIEKDDGQISVLKGFTAADFDKALGVETPVATPPVSEPVQAPQSVQAPEPVEPAVQPEAVPTPPMPVEVSPVAPVEPVTAPAPVAQPEVAPVPATTTDPAMAFLLNNLQQAQVAQPPVAPPVADTPVIPDPKF